MQIRNVLIAISLALVACTTGAWAKSIPSEGITRDEMVAYLKSKGLPATPAFESGNNHRILKTTIDGVNIDIYFLDCVTDDAGRCASLQFAASWRADSTTVDQVNAWNRQKRFMRAYLTESGSTLWAEYDMYLAPSGSTELIDQNISMLKVLFKNLKSHFNF